MRNIIIVKIGSSSLVFPGGAVRRKVIDHITGQIVFARELGYWVVVVTSGATLVGLAKAPWLASIQDEVFRKQMAASVGQPTIAQAWIESFAMHGIAAGQVAEVLRARDDVLFGYVFGSTATNSRRKGSDVDVAVYLDPRCKDRFFEIRLELLDQLTRALGSEADVTVLNTAAPFLRYVAVREGVLAFDRSPEARISFELKVLNEYFDYQPVLERYRARLAASV